MDQRVWPAAGFGALAVGAVASAWWVFSVDAGFVPAPAEVPLAPAVTVQAPAPAPRAHPRGRARVPRARAPSAEPPRRAARPAPDADPAPEPGRRLDADELMWVRTEYRTERIGDMSARLDAHAAAAGWSPDLTEQVRAVLVETIETITAELVEVDAGSRDWHEVKADLRAFREDQARQVEAILGPERFEPFVTQMGFDRFEGDEPKQGRVRLRRPRHGRR